jgi:hypothetical protein
VLKSELHTDQLVRIIDQYPHLLEGIVAVIQLKEEGVDMDDWECWLAPLIWPNEQAPVVSKDFLQDLNTTIEES